MRMDTEERHRSLEKVVERIGRMANITLRERRYFVELVHRAADIAGVGAVFRRMIERNDAETLDHLAEIKYGVLLGDLGFLAQFEPTGTKGPDLLVARDGVAAFMEVKRYRPKEVDSIPESLGPGGTLPNYGGNTACTQAQIEKDLLGKIHQIEPRNGVQHGVLAVWSDRSSFENDVFTCAVRRISPKARQKSLRFCVFGSEFLAVGPQRFFCEPASLPEKPFRSWMEDIEATR